MARPRSDDKRSAIISAATRVIASEGLGAATATIAKEAGVSNGSLFTYFETKKVLFNELYLVLKAEMASAALKSLPRNASIRKQLFSVWSNWMHWAITDPDKRRALAQLSVSEEITPGTRAESHKPMAGIAELLQRCRTTGPPARSVDELRPIGHERACRNNHGFHDSRSNACRENIASWVSTRCGEF